MTDTMKERIARAICKDMTGDVHDYELYRDTADAVLAAMREPTEEMVKAGDLPGWDGDVTVDLSREVWQAMIDAAITEGKT